MSAAVGDKLYVFGGFVNEDLETTRLVHVYDPSTDRWDRLGNLPFEGLTHANAVADGRLVWIAGGFVGAGAMTATAEVRRYDTVGDTWSAGPSLPVPTGGGMLVRSGHHLHYISGFVDAYQDGAEDEHWVLDLGRLDGWRAQAPLPVARGHAGAAVIDGKIYVAGGTTTHYPARESALVHRYDPGTGRWERCSDLPSPRSHFESATFVHDGRMFIVGGQDHVSGRLAEPEIADISIYDPARDTWHTVPGLTMPLRSTVAAVMGDNLIVTTGSTFLAHRPQSATWRTPCSGAGYSICRDGAFARSQAKAQVRSGLKWLAARTPLRMQDWLQIENLAGLE